MENYGKIWGGQRGGSVSASASRELLYLHATCLGGRALGRRPSDASATWPAAWGTAGSSARVMEVLCSLPTTSSLGCSVGRGRFPEPRLPRGGDGKLLDSPPLAAGHVRVAYPGASGRQRHTREVTEQSEVNVLRE